MSSSWLLGSNRSCGAIDGQRAFPCLSSFIHCQSSHVPYFLQTLPLSNHILQFYWDSESTGATIVPRKWGMFSLNCA